MYKSENERRGVIFFFSEKEIEIDNNVKDVDKKKGKKKKGRKMRFENNHFLGRKAKNENCLFL